GALQVAIGVYGLVSIAILGRLFYGLDSWWDGFSNAHWGTAPWLTFAKTFAVILPPTLAMGAAFPVVVKITARGPNSVGRAVGTAYAANTLGAIAGAWATGFLAIPLLGTHHGLALTALISMGIGGILLTAGAVSARRQGLIYAGVLGLFAAVMIAVPALHFSDIAGEPEKEGLHYEGGGAGVGKVAARTHDRQLASLHGGGR